MYLFLQFPFNRFEIIQGSSIGCMYCGMCFFFDDRNYFEFLAHFRNFRNNGRLYINCKLYLFLQFLFKFKFVLKLYRARAFLTIESILNFLAIFFNF